MSGSPFESASGGRRASAAAAACAAPFADISFPFLADSSGTFAPGILRPFVRLRFTSRTKGECPRPSRRRFHREGHEEGPDFFDSSGPPDPHMTSSKDRSIQGTSRIRTGRICKEGSDAEAGDPPPSGFGGAWDGRNPRIEPAGTFRGNSGRARHPCNERERRCADPQDGKRRRKRGADSVQLQEGRHRPLPKATFGEVHGSPEPRNEGGREMTARDELPGKAKWRKAPWHAGIASVGRTLAAFGMPAGFMARPLSDLNAGVASLAARLDETDARIDETNARLDRTKPMKGSSKLPWKSRKPRQG